MKKIASWSASFLVGFALFFAGGAVANEVSVPPSEDQLVVETETPTPEQEQIVEVPLEEAPVEDVQIVEGPQPVVVNEDPVFCWNIGKGNELGGDCFCVQGSVTDMAEVDCLIASGIVPASSYDDYRRHLGIID